MLKEQAAVKITLLTFLLFGFSPLTFAVAPEAHIPAELKPWIPWVLEGDDRRSCPLTADGAERLCAWPGRLDLDLNRSGGLFAQRWRVYARSWVPLPGDADHWPQGVRVGADAAAVVAQGGSPAVWLDPGDHAISGRFIWGRTPDGLAIPPVTGLVSLLLDGEEVLFPRREVNGRLWLGAGAGAVDRTERDSFGLEVYRRVEDDNPLRVVTRLDMDVAGQTRELILGPVLLAGGIPLSLDSPLPARLELDGRLRLQVRPGHWVVQVAAHHPGPVAELGPRALSPPWPDAEVWVFAAHPQLRQVELAEAEPVDPRQTRLPAEWARLPAYLMSSGKPMRLVQVRRGDARPAPDRLSLERDIWLDFRGTGYTLRDRISGELTRSSRLEVGEGLELGQVSVHGQPRFITRLQDSPVRGVEVRQGEIDLVADSRIEDRAGRLPASGWRLDFQSLLAHLHLPPGWDLLAVSGVDNLPDSWLNRWTLLDLFLVLVVALAAARLWGWGWGAFALVAMVLTWQEPGAPRMIWLNLLAAFALLRLLPEGPAGAAMPRLRRLLRWYFRGSLAFLAVTALPFLVEDVRTGIYPQLERPWPVVSVPAAPVTDALHLDAEAPMAERSGMGKGIRPKAAPSLAVAPSPQPLPTVDPDARVQTGPGVPVWRWQALDLTWSGPVPRGHQVELLLLTPGWNLVLSFARLVLVLVLALKLAGLLDLALKRSPTVAVLLLAIGLSGTSTPVPAGEFPSPEMLEALKERLLEHPDCFPACVDIPRMELSATADELKLVLTVDAAATVALPVPGSLGVWTPTLITRNGESLDGLRRSAKGTFLVALEAGRWQLGFSGPLPRRAQIEIPLPLRPRLVEAVVAGWRMEGVDAMGRPDAQIRLVRLRTEGQGNELGPTAVPPLLRVERTLQLGVDWRVQTRVARLSPPDVPVVLDVPLIAGEQVTSEGARVRNGQLLVSLVPGQMETSWASSLEPVENVLLHASEDERLSEEWRLDLSPLWHLETSGFPMAHHQGRLERWLPTWRPWPGEELLLSFSRPEGVPGPTLTLDESTYRLRPGSRMAEATLELKLRSSQGGKHEIRLPAGAELRRVAVDGVERPLRLDGERLSLPLAPKAQRFRIEWQQPGPLDTYYSPPVPEMGIDGVNASVQIGLGRDRWVLFVGGPTVGPAVLYWGLVVVLVLLATGLGRSRITPLHTLDWLLLGLGLSQAGIWVGLLVAGWLFALGLRGRMDADLTPWRFNLMQIGLFLLSLAALAALVAALQQGLLGLPEMQIAGNGSTSTRLDWYQDRSGSELPHVWVLSVPILVYRALMLAWALWLAYRLLGWLRWGWQGMSSPVLWREVKLSLPDRKRPTRGPASERKSAPIEKDGPDLEFR